MTSNCSMNLTNIMTMVKYNLMNMENRQNYPSNHSLRTKMTLTLVVSPAVITLLGLMTNASQVRILTNLEKKSKVLTLRWTTQWWFLAITRPRSESGGKTSISSSSSVSWSLPTYALPIPKSLSLTMTRWMIAKMKRGMGLMAEIVYLGVDNLQSDENLYCF